MSLFLDYDSQIHVTHYQVLHCGMKNSYHLLVAYVLYCTYVKYMCRVQIVMNFNYNNRCCTIPKYAMKVVYLTEIIRRKHAPFITTRITSDHKSWI